LCHFYYINTLKSFKLKIKNKNLVLIKIMFKYSLWNLLKEYNDNKHIIDATFRGDSLEGMTATTSSPSGDNSSSSSDCWDERERRLICGMEVRAFTMAFYAMLLLWVWGLLALIEFWDKLYDWAQILSVVALVTGAGPISLLITYSSRKSM